MSVQTVTGAYLQANKAVYEGFMEERQTVDEYVQSNIDLPRVEIEHQGIDALYNAILGPAGISLEITYLNRSPADVLQPIVFKPESSESGDDQSIFMSSTIRLLYTLP